MGVALSGLWAPGMKRQKANYLDNITWSELRKQSLQTLKVNSTSRLRQILIFQIAPLVQVAHFESPAVWPLRVYFFGKKVLVFQCVSFTFSIISCAAPRPQLIRRRLTHPALLRRG